MGLDVYLTKYEDHETAHKIRAEHMRRSDALYKIKDPQKRAQHAERFRKWCNKNRITENGRIIDSEEINIPSSRWPQHLFRIGYMRSSYNEGGFNSFMQSYYGTTLYDIFSADASDMPEFRPDWHNARESALELSARVRSDIETNGFQYIQAPKTYTLSTKHDGAATPKQAIKLFAKEVEECTTIPYTKFPPVTVHFPPKTAYSAEYNRHSIFAQCRDIRQRYLKIVAQQQQPRPEDVFFTEDTVVVAEISGSRKDVPVPDALSNKFSAVPCIYTFTALREDVLNIMQKYKVRELSPYFFHNNYFAFNAQHPCPALMVELLDIHGVPLPFYCSVFNLTSTDLSNTSPQWYLQALDVVVEMCDWVLSQTDSDKFYLYWSS